MSKRVTRLGVITFLCIGFSGTIIPHANAYLGPDVGSLIFQAVVGVFAATGAAFVVFRDKVRGWFTRKPPKIGGTPTDE